MYLDDLREKQEVISLVFEPGETPHGTIECNRECNIQCRACYNLFRNYTKPLELVKSEVRALLALRKLQAITIVGGEPTIYPYLAETVRYIKEQGCFCQLLTNGRVFLEPKGNPMLTTLKRTGVDRILVHIDEGQEAYYPDIEEARARVFEKLENRNIHFGLSVTVYPDNKGKLGRLSSRYSALRYFDGVLAVLVKNPENGNSYNVELIDEYRAIQKDLRIEPIFYVPSNVEEEKITWLGFYYFINPVTGETCQLPVSFLRRLRKWYRAFRGRHYFTSLIKPRLTTLFFVGLTLYTRLFDKQWYNKNKTLIKDIGYRDSLRFHFIIIQVPPGFNDKAGKTEVCRGCPDATIRNGRLLPVCLADLLEPIDGINRINEERRNRIEEACATNVYGK